MQVSTGKARQRTNAIQTMAVKSALHTLDLCSGVYGISTNALPKPPHLTLSLSLSLSLSLPISCLFTEQLTLINSAFRRKQEKDHKPQTMNSHSKRGKIK